MEYIINSLFNFNMKKLHNVFLIKEVLSYLQYKNILPIIQKNKKIQNILNISINDYKIYSSIKLAFIKISNFNTFFENYKEKNPNLTKDEIKEIILEYLIKYSKKENSKICLDLNQEITEEFAAKIKNNIYLYMFSPLVPLIRVLFNKYKKLESIKSITLSEECQKIRKCDLIELAKNFKWNFIRYFKCKAELTSCIFLDEFIKKILYKKRNNLNLETFYANGNFNYKNIPTYFEFLKQNENLKYLRFFGNQLDYINVYYFSEAFGKLKKLNKLKFTNFNVNLSNIFNIFKYNLKNIEKFTYEEKINFNNNIQINNIYSQNNFNNNEYEIINNNNNTELNNFNDNNNNGDNEILLNPPKNLINLIKCSIISKNIELKFYTNLIDKNKNLEYLQFNIEKTDIKIKNEFLNFIESINKNQNFKTLIIENKIEDYFCDIINSNLKSKNIEKLKLIHGTNLNFDLILKNNQNLKKIDFKLIDNNQKNNINSSNQDRYQYYNYSRIIIYNPFNKYLINNNLNSQSNETNKFIDNNQNQKNDQNSFKYNFPKERDFIEISLDSYPEISKTNIERLITYKNLEIISFNNVKISSDNIKILGENLKVFYKIEKLNLYNIFIYKNEKNNIYYPLYEYVRPILINLKDIPLLREFFMDGINSSKEIISLLRYQLQFLPFLNKNNLIC